jgi:hypothetical protein
LAKSRQPRPATFIPALFLDLLAAAELALGKPKCFLMGMAGALVFSGEVIEMMSEFAV